MGKMDERPTPRHRFKVEGIEGEKKDKKGRKINK